MNCLQRRPSQQLNKEIDAYQSDIALRIQGFNRQTPILFTERPLSLSHPIPSIDFNHPDGHELQAHEAWITATLEVLDRLEGDAGTGKEKDAVVLGRCGGMRRQISKEVLALKGLKEAAWKSEIIKAGFLGPIYTRDGNPVRSQVITPIEVDTGKPSFELAIL